MLYIYTISHKSLKVKSVIYKQPYIVFPGNCAIWVESVLSLSSKLTKYTFCDKLKKAKNVI